MKISIVTVCYNSGSTIEDTILSIMSQTYNEIEYIVVDGGSTDNTLSILDKYKDQINKYISEFDNGLYDAMNKGVKLATGDVVGILNSDDVLYDEFVVERVVKAISSVDAVYGDVAFYKGENMNKMIRYYSSSGFSKKKLARGIMPAHPSLYVKRQCLLDVGPYNTRYKIASDFDLIVRLFSLSNFSSRYIPSLLIKMRTGGISTSGFKSTILLNKEIIISCRSNGIDSNWFKILSKYPIKIFYAIFVR